MMTLEGARRVFTEGLGTAAEQDAEQDAVIAAMVRERRALRTKSVCLRERLEQADKVFQMASGIANRGASGLENGQTAQFATAEYPTASDLRSMVADLADVRERIRVIDERLNEC